MKIHLVGAMLVGIAIAGCSPSEPRSTQYFEAHIDEARQIVQECRDGPVRGAECDNADIAVQTSEAKERRKRFFGDRNAYTPRQ